MKNVFNATDNSPIAAIGFYTFGSSNYEAYMYINDELKSSK